jgi:hypothetical protein
VPELLLELAEAGTLLAAYAMMDMSLAVPSDLARVEFHTFSHSHE